MGPQQSSTSVVQIESPQRTDQGAPGSARPRRELAPPEAVPSGTGQELSLRGNRGTTARSLSSSGTVPRCGGGVYLFGVFREGAHPLLGTVGKTVTKYQGGAKPLAHCFHMVRGNFFFLMLSEPKSCQQSNEERSRCTNRKFSCIEETK